MTGPRSEPPIPMLITFRMRFPVWPFQVPSRTRSANSLIRSSTAWTSDTTSWPSTTIFDPRAQAGLLGQLHQEREGLVRDPVLRVVEEDTRGLRRQALAAPGVVGKEP